VAIETMRLGGIAHNFWGLIGSIVRRSCRLHAKHLNQLYGYMELSREAVKA
jgi:hypothetical protein